MTVKELIGYLSKYDENAQVHLDYKDKYTLFNFMDGLNIKFDHAKIHEIIDGKYVASPVCLIVIGEFDDGVLWELARLELNY